jgi:hypothetical protein
LRAWLTEPPPTRSTTNPPATTPTATATATPAAPEAALVRQAEPPTTTSTTGAVRGRLLDEAGQPFAGASVGWLGDDDTLRCVTTSTRDGDFLLLGVPLTVGAVRIEAPGHVAVQLGDLDPATARDHSLDLGTLTLSAAVLWQGTVVANGRPVPDATVTVTAPLGAPGTPHPVALRGTSDANGDFLFAMAPPPPAFLHVRADGYRTVPPREVTTTPQALRIELQPLPRLVARVVEAANGAPLAGAKVWLWPFEFAVADASRLPPHPDPAAPPVVTGAEGRLDAVLPEAPFVVVQVAAAGCATQLFGSFATDDIRGEPTFALSRGHGIEGVVTWQGDPTPAAARLLRAPLDPVGPPGELVTSAAVGDDGQLRLPAVPDGDYLLEVDSDHGARWTGRVLVRGATPPPLIITIPAGARGLAQVLGEVPTGAVVVCTHTSGVRRRGAVAADGRSTVPGLMPGAWRAKLEVAAGSWRDAAAAMLDDLAPAPGFEVVGERDVTFDVVAPSRRFGSIQGRTAPSRAGQRVKLVGDDPALPELPPGLALATIADDGTFAFDPVLPGRWRVAPHGTEPAATEATRAVVVVGGEVAVVLVD